MARRPHLGCSLFFFFFFTVHELRMVFTFFFFLHFLNNERKKDQKENISWHMKWNSNFSICKWSFVGIHHSRMAAFLLQRQNWVVLTETAWLAKSKLFTLWAFWEKVCQSVGDNFPHAHTPPPWFLDQCSHFLAFQLSANVGLKQQWGRLGLVRKGLRVCLTRRGLVRH